MSSAFFPRGVCSFSHVNRHTSEHGYERFNADKNFDALNDNFIFCSVASGCSSHIHNHIHIRHTAHSNFIPFALFIFFEAFGVAHFFYLVAGLIPFHVFVFMCKRWAMDVSMCVWIHPQKVGGKKEKNGAQVQFESI